MFQIGNRFLRCFPPPAPDAKIDAVDKCHSVDQVPEDSVGLWTCVQCVKCIHGYYQDALHHDCEAKSCDKVFRNDPSMSRYCPEIVRRGKAGLASYCPKAGTASEELIC